MEPLLFERSLNQVTVANATAFAEGMLKLMFVVSFLLFFAFAFVVVRQVKLMSATIQTPLDGALSLLSYAYLFVTAGLLLLVFFAL